MRSPDPAALGRVRADRRGDGRHRRQASRIAAVSDRGNEPIVRRAAASRGQRVRDDGRGHDPELMHPLLARLDYAAAYVGAWLVAGVLLCTSLARQGVAWADALVFVVPTFAMYGFVCLSAWYVSRAMPLTTRRAAAVA